MLTHRLQDEDLRAAHFPRRAKLVNQLQIYLLCRDYPYLQRRPHLLTQEACPFAFQHLPTLRMYASRQFYPFPRPCNTPDCRTGISCVLETAIHAPRSYQQYYRIHRS